VIHAHQCTGHNTSTKTARRCLLSKCPQHHQISYPRANTSKMASRNRFSARPIPSRSSVAPSPAPSAARRPAPQVPDLPPYKKPSHPLGRRAEDQLRALMADRSSISKSKMRKLAKVSLVLPHSSMTRSENATSYIVIITSKYYFIILYTLILTSIK
jgi:hypothetical protein